MGEAYTPPGSGEAPSESPEGLEHEAPELEQEGEGEGEDDGSEESETKRWEKQAHDKAGLAAKERSRRRAAERSLNELRGRFDALEQRIQGGGRDELVDLISGLRDDDDEPITDISQIKKALKTFLARDQQEAQTSAQRAQHVHRVNNISNNMTAYEQDFVESHPDYMQAAAHLRQERQNELEDMGYTGHALMSKLATELYGMVEEAMNGGRDPAEVVYNMAKRRGFSAGAKAANEKLQKLQRANGTAPPPGSSAGAGRSWSSVAKATGKDFDKEFAALRKRELGKR